MEQVAAVLIRVITHCHAAHHVTAPTAIVLLLAAVMAVRRGGTGCDDATSGAVQ